MNKAISHDDQTSDPRSQLLISFFDRLNREHVCYAVMNNYEDLPRVIPSDVDITVPQAFFMDLDKFVLDFSASAGATVVQKFWHGNEKCAYIICIGAEGTRAFLQLDFFVSFSTKGCPVLLSHEELTVGARELREFRVPAPEVELLFIVMRRLFKNDWSKRHTARIAELRARIVQEAWLPYRYAWLSETIEQAVKGDVRGVSARRAADWARLRKTVHRNLGISGQLMNAGRQMRRITHRLRNDTGLIAVIEDSDRAIIDGAAMELLEMVFHRHMCVDEKCLSVMSAFGRLFLLARLALLKRRKGLVFLYIGPGEERSLKLARRLERFGLIDLQLVGKAPSMGLTASRATATRPTQAIESIVLRQSEKTARTITFGGTQTSGWGHDD